jgi:hypothetical protein
MGILRTNTLSGIGTDGPVFDGVTRLDTFGYVVPPVGVTSDRTLVGVTTAQGSIRFNTDSQKLEFYAQDQWWEMVIDTPALGVAADTGAGARGVFAGGYSPAVYFNTIDYINISSTGNAVSFGSLTSAVVGNSGCASATRGILAGAYTPGSYLNTIQYITISSTGNAVSFGSLTNTVFNCNSLASSTRGVTLGGFVPGGLTNVIQYITIASTGNAVSFGTLSSQKGSGSTCASPTRGIYAGGVTPTPATINVIEYITIATLGNAQDFGDLATVSSSNCDGGCSNAIRALFAKGVTPSVSNAIDYITIATLGNAVNFGSLTNAKNQHGACASSTRGVWSGGYNTSPGTPFSNVIEYTLISTQGNAVDFGDLTVERRRPYGCSNAHGGL